MKVIGKRKPFKTNNSRRSCMVYSFLMSLLWERKDVMNALGQVAQQFMSFTIVLNTILLSRRSLFAAFCEEVDYFTPSISIGSITIGGNVVHTYEKL